MLFREEPELRQRFGEAYVRYMHSVRRGGSDRADIRRP